MRKWTVASALLLSCGALLLAGEDIKLRDVLKDQKYADGWIYEDIDAGYGVRVRLVQMGGVDLNIFQFDPLLSWSLFFMNGNKTIYGRFGTASPQAKRSKKDSNDNHTLTGMKAALKGALAVHDRYMADRDAMGKRLASKTGPKPLWRYVEKTPQAKRYKRMGRMRGDKGLCVHCHEVQRAAIDSYFMKKKRLPDRMLWMYPHPEVVGVTLDRDRSARVQSVKPDSPAARAGLEAGDDVVSFAGQPLVSVADFVWVLQITADEGGKLPITVARGGKTMDLKLELAPLWRRKGDFGWRYRVAGYAAWLWGGVTLSDHADGVLVASRSPSWFEKPNRDARRELKPGDVIVEVDGKKDWTRSTYLAYLMRDKKPGAVVKLKIRRGGRLMRVSFRVPPKRPEVLGH